MSRVNLTRRFTDLVGQPPMTYLRERRLALAADLLREPDATLAAAAARVGFSSAFALSAAFKREHGISPNEFRARGTGGGPTAPPAHTPWRGGRRRPRKLPAGPRPR